MVAASCVDPPETVLLTFAQRASVGSTDASWKKIRRSMLSYTPVTLNSCAAVQILAIAVGGFAVPGHHLHLPVRSDPDAAASWLDDVAERRLCWLFGVVGWVKPTDQGLCTRGFHPPYTCRPGAVCRAPVSERRTTMLHGQSLSPRRA